MGLALMFGACALPASTSLPPSVAAGCSQEVLDRGAGWKEVGGPRAFVLAYPVVADPVHPYKVFVRFEQDLEPPFTVEARMRDGTLHEKGWINDVIQRNE